MRSIRHGVGVAWVVVPPLVLVHDRIGWIYGTRGKSMAPVLNPQDTWYDRYVSDVVLVLRESSGMCELARGDVVMAVEPQTGCRIVKRLYAEDGQWVPRDGRYVQVSRGHIWLQGDCEEHSVDSRTFGPVPRGLVQGKVIMRLFPWWRPTWIE